MRSDKLGELPADLPVPVDDGGCDHLVGAVWPEVELPATDGSFLRPSVSSDLVVVYAYPRTGRPDSEPAGGVAAWNAIPGARGCTPQSCGYRDRHSELRALGARVYGLSSQSSEYQLEAATRLHLPFALVSDEHCELVDALGLPTFEFAGERLIKRLTMVVRDGVIAHVIYPVYPPDADADRVIEYLNGCGAP